MKKHIATILLGSALLCSACEETCKGSREGEEESPYISRVLEYCPAPGQFINIGASAAPEGKEAPTREEVLAKVSQALVGKTNAQISLGGWGGYITVGFDTPIRNLPDARDFKVYGNAFWEQAMGITDGGSCEPGVIYVSRDANGNGLADDEWFEIAGNADKDAVKGYRLTYYRTATPGDVRWKDNRGEEGVLKHNPDFHPQNYYPAWAAADSLTFEGTLLPGSAKWEEKNGFAQWVLYTLGWGYADNYPNREEGCNIDIDWAVDKQGNPAGLPEIHFIRIQTGQNQQCGPLGETSTELGGIENLNPEA